MSQSSTQTHSQSQQQRNTTVSSPRPRTQSTDNASKQTSRSGRSITKPARFRLEVLSDTGLVYFKRHSCFWNICECLFFAIYFILSADSSQIFVKLLYILVSIYPFFLSFFLLRPLFFEMGYCYTLHNTTRVVQLCTTPRRTLAHAISISYAHTRKSSLASCLFSPLLAVCSCFVCYLGRTGT